MQSIGLSIVLFLVLISEHHAQKQTAACGEKWAVAALNNLVQIHKAENVEKYVENRPCRILVLPFFRSKQEGFDASGYDTTLLGQSLARNFSTALGVAIRNEEKIRKGWEILPSNDNAIFQNSFVCIRPETYFKESEENKRRLVELQPDFLLCGEYEMNSEGIALLNLRLTRVGHFLNPFPKAEIPVFSGYLNFPFVTSGAFSEWKTKDVAPFDYRPFKELMDKFTGIPLKPLGVKTINVGHSNYTLDSLDGDLKANVNYKLAIKLPEPLYIYAFSYERLDADKKYLYFIKSVGAEQVRFPAGKSIFPPEKAGFGFTINQDFEEGYPIYLKVFACQEPVFLNTIEKKKKADKIIFLTPDMARHFVEQLKSQQALGKKVYTAELTKYLEK